MTRQAEIRDFLKAAGWAKATITPLAGDASFRRYDRISMGDKQAVLMDAPPAHEDCRPFVAIARHLLAHGFRPPQLLAVDLERGLLLLEDLGDDLFARYVARFPDMEKTLYMAAVEVLLALNDDQIDETLSLVGPNEADGSYDVPPYDMALLLKEVGLFTDWYLPALTGLPTPPPLRAEFMALWQQVLQDVALPERSVLVLRDYHAENLLWCPDSEGLQRVGLLDFQDGVIGHPAYDLVSLLQDARRDVSPTLEDQMLVHFVLASGMAEEPFRRDYALLGAQRNTKIIGIFARLCLRDGKETYLDLIPRVWGLLARDLEHPALAPLKAWFDLIVPTEVRSAILKPKAAGPQVAMILAAGLGLRMRPLTNDRPKPLIKAAGKTLLDHSLDQLAANGVGKAVVNIHYKAEMVEAHVANRKGLPAILLSDERAALKDSGGGLVQALPLLEEAPCFVLNSDMIWTDGEQLTLRRLAAHWQDRVMDVLLLLVPREKAPGYEGSGDFNLDVAGTDQDVVGRLSFRGAAPHADYVYTGIQIIHPRILQGYGDDAFSLRRVFEVAEAQGRLYGLVHDGGWCHVGTPDMVETVTPEFIDKL